MMETLTLVVLVLGTSNAVLLDLLALDDKAST